MVTHACNNLAPGEPLYLVMGGFHLMGQVYIENKRFSNWRNVGEQTYEAILERTISDL